MTGRSPATVQDELHLEDLLARPSAADVDFARTLSGDVLVLGAGGKMGPRSHVASGARCGRAAPRHASSPHRASPTRRCRAALAQDGIETARLRPPRSGTGRAAAARGQRPLPGRPEVRLHRPPGPHLGLTRGRAHAVARHFAGARIVVFSSGNVYPLVAPRLGGLHGSGRDRPRRRIRAVLPGPRARVRVLLARGGTPCLLFRLFYAVDLRYGTLVDIARHVFAGEPVDLRWAAVSAIWQGDANSYALRSLALCASPARPLVVTGPAPVSRARGGGRFGAVTAGPCASRARRAARAPRQSGRLRIAALGPPEVPLDAARRVDGRLGRDGRTQPRQAHEVRARPMADSETTLRDGARAAASPSPPSAGPHRGAASWTNDGRPPSPATTATRARAGSRSACTRRSSQSAIPRSASSSRCSPWPWTVLREREKATAARSRSRWPASAAPRRRRSRRPSSPSRLGYDVGLLSLAALREASNDALIAHCRRIGEVIPLFGFYLQPAVGGAACSTRPSGARSSRSQPWWRSRWRRSAATRPSTSRALSP